MKTRKKTDVYQIVTDKILTMLEQGTVPWHKPWKGGVLGMPKNLISKKAYRGMNVWLLSMEAEEKGYASPYWMTYKQAESLGGNVRKGERSTLIVFWRFIDREVTDDTGGKAIDTIPMLRYYNVFNLEQTENVDVEKLPADAYIEQDTTNDIDSIPICENIVANMQKRPEITNNEAQAYYRPSTDTVNMPKMGLFEVAEEYYSTLYHELVHSTKHESRLNRGEKSEAVYFGSEDYSKEELVAEMGAAMLCGLSGIETKTIDNSASYIAGWMKRIKNDKRLVICAAGKAQKAVDYITAD